MPTIFKHETFDAKERQTRADFIDKHMPYILHEGTAKKGVPFTIRVRVGKEFSHIDDFNHYISTISVFDGDSLLAKVELAPCIVSAEEHRGNVDFTLSIVPSKSIYHLSAQCYCTKHGTWQSDTIDLNVEG